MDLRPQILGFHVAKGDFSLFIIFGMALINFYYTQSEIQTESLFRDLFCLQDDQ